MSLRCVLGFHTPGLSATYSTQDDAPFSLTVSVLFCGRCGDVMATRPIPRSGGSAGEQK